MGGDGVLIRFLTLMDLHIIPVLVANKIERIQRNFLWGGKREGKRYHLVSWETICQAKSSGGLGSRDWLLLIGRCWGSGFGILLCRGIGIGDG